MSSLRSSFLFVLLLLLLAAVFVSCNHVHSAAGAVSSSSSSATSLPPHVSIPSLRIAERDFGRELFYHGLNVVVKGVPWIPLTTSFDVNLSFSEEDMKLFQDSGWNIIRLGVMWPGVYPNASGSPNATYLSELRQLVRRAATYDIQVLLDMHQDCFSLSLCGEGIPDWVTRPVLEDAEVPRFPEPVSEAFQYDIETGVPSPEDCAKLSWPEYQVTAAGSHAYQALYSNLYNMTDHWKQFWTTVAQYFKDEPSVVAYELINEPFAGDVYEDPELWIPGEADKRNLLPVYNQLVDTIRQVDQQHIISFESVTWDDFGVGFDNVPGGDAARELSVLSYHYYQPPQIFPPGYTFDIRLRDMQKLQCGGMLTEFDTNEMDSDGPMEATMQAAEQRGQSWIGWEYKPYYEAKTGNDHAVWFANGTLNMHAVRRLSRTYAQKVAGHLLGSTFERDPTVRYTVNYVACSNCTGGESSSQYTTDIYLNAALDYPSGVSFSYKWVTSQCSQVEVLHQMQDRNHLLVQHQPLQIPAGVDCELQLVVQSS